MASDDSVRWCHCDSQVLVRVDVPSVPDVQKINWP